MALGGVARRRGRGRLPCAWSREAPAPSTRARRAWVWLDFTKSLGGENHSVHAVNTSASSAPVQPPTIFA
jgi:hypothetical protein